MFIDRGLFKYLHDWIEKNKCYHNDWKDWNSWLQNQQSKGRSSFSSWLDPWVFTVSSSNKKNQIKKKNLKFKVSFEFHVLKGGWQYCQFSKPLLEKKYYHYWDFSVIQLKFNQPINDSHSHSYFRPPHTKK